MSPIYIDLSHTLESDTQVYPGDPPFSSCPVLTIPKDGNTVHSISMGSHTGTHIDAPYHFFESGSRVDEIPLSTFTGNAVVINLAASVTQKARVTWADLSAYEDLIRQKATLEHGVFVLICTGWSRHWKSDKYIDHPFLDAAAAKKLLELGAKLIGVDTLSPDETRVDGTAPDFGVHKAVLGVGAILAENLTNLEAICEGDWLVSLIPLKLRGCDGSPVRAFAWSKDGSETH